MGRSDGNDVFIDSTVLYALLDSTHEAHDRVVAAWNELLRCVVRLQVPYLDGEWTGYSLGYAFLLGAAEWLGVPDTDLNVTIAGVDVTETVASTTASIVLYDNVPAARDWLLNWSTKVCSGKCYGTPGTA